MSHQSQNRLTKLLGHLSSDTTAVNAVSCSSSVLDGKCALITGSTSGIGLCIAKNLASRGCKIVLTGLGDSIKAMNEVKKVAKYPNDIYYLDYNLNDVPNSPKDLVLEAINIMKSNRCDIVVNNAGLQYISPIETFPDDKFELLMNVMLHSPFYITKAVIPFMRRNGFGRIINISSAHGKVASVKKAAYCSAKHGIIGLTKVTALEMGAESDINWTCNAICPGWTETELAKAQVIKRANASGKTYQEEEFMLLDEKHGQPKWVQPSDIASFIEYLCSDSAKQINGAALSIDAAWTAQ